jgi:hypothetical protein
MSFHSALDKFHSVLALLANGELGWMVVLMLWATELAIAVSLFLTIRHARGLEVDLQDARRSIVSLRNGLARISRELRSQQDELRSWRHAPPDAPHAADSASHEESHPSVTDSDHDNEDGISPPNETETSTANLRAGEDAYGQDFETPKQVGF